MPFDLFGKYFTLQDISKETGLSPTGVTRLLKNMPETPITYVGKSALIPEDVFLTIVEAYLSGGITTSQIGSGSASVKSDVIAKKLGVPSDSVVDFLRENPSLYIKKKTGKIFWVLIENIDIVCRHFK